LIHFEIFEGEEVVFAVLELNGIQQARDFVDQKVRVLFKGKQLAVSSVSKGEILISSPFFHLPD